MIGTDGGAEAVDVGWRTVSHRQEWALLRNDEVISNLESILRTTSLMKFRTSI